MSFFPSTMYRCRFISVCSESTLSVVLPDDGVFLPCDHGVGFFNISLFKEKYYCYVRIYSFVQLCMDTTGTFNMI